MYFMSKYDEMTINEIISNTNMQKIEQERMIKLLDLGVKYTKKSIDVWQKNFDALVKYINSAEEIKKQFKLTGRVDTKVIVEIDGKKVKIGSWLQNNKNVLMKKYQGKTKEEIQLDETIPIKDKEKMVKLLDLGVKYLDMRTSDDKWEENYNLFVEYLNSSIEAKEFSEKSFLYPEVFSRSKTSPADWAEMSLEIKAGRNL